MTLQIPSIKLYNSKYVGHDVLATRTRACLLTMCLNLGVCKSEFLQNRTNLAMSVRSLKSHLTDPKKDHWQDEKKGHNDPRVNEGPGRTGTFTWVESLPLTSILWARRDSDNASKPTAERRSVHPKESRTGPGIMTHVYDLELWVHTNWPLGSPGPRPMVPYWYNRTKQHWHGRKTIRRTGLKVFIQTWKKLHRICCECI